MDTAGRGPLLYGGNTNLSLIIQTSVKFRDFVELFFVSFLEQIVPTVGSFNDFKKLKNLSQDPLYNI